MSTDKYEALGPILGDVGNEIAQIVGGDPDGAYLYVEAGDGWVGAGVFKDEGGAVRYFDPSHALNELLMDAWEAEEPEKRWAVMEYEIRGGKFDAQFKYSEELKPNEYESDRRERALEERYGDKRVIYPPMPEEWQSIR